MMRGFPTHRKGDARTKRRTETTNRNDEPKRRTETTNRNCEPKLRTETANRNCEPKRRTETASLKLRTETEDCGAVVVAVLVRLYRDAVSFRRFGSPFWFAFSVRSFGSLLSLSPHPDWRQL